MDMILLSSIKRMQYLMTNAWIVMLDKVHCVFAYTVMKIILMDRIRPFIIKKTKFWVLTIVKVVILKN